VEEVIGDFVQLKKSGSNFKGLSPFTDERTPSFMVSPVKQIWKDFSSGKGGNVVAFVMEHEHYSYPEAIRYLAKKYQIEIEETEQTDEEREKADKRESLFLVSEYARDYFTEHLWESQGGRAIGQTYFKERGFTEETIRHFELGYCGEGWEDFSKTAIEKGYKEEFLTGTGLSIAKEDKEGKTRFIDRFRARVLFPIHSMSGRVLGFGGRILDQSKKAAKYLNSPESEIYHKSKVLYGIFYAKKAIAKEDNCYLVEGYTDVIQFYQKGIENVVASSGTALTPEQVRLVSRLTKNITVLFDGDAAGQRAALRGVDIILEQGLSVKVCTFPEGQDPDSFAKNNSLDELKEYLEENTLDFIRFKAKLLLEEAGDDPMKRAATIQDMVDSIAKIPSRIQQEIYVQECAGLMRISEQVLYSSLAQVLERKGRKTQEDHSAQKVSGEMELVHQKAQESEVDQLFYLEKKIIEILLLYGNQTEEFEEVKYLENEKGEMEEVTEVLESRVSKKIFLELQEDEIELSNEDFRIIYQELITTLENTEEFDSSEFTNSVNQDLVLSVSNILMEDQRYSLSDWQQRDIYPKPKTSEVRKLVEQTILNFRSYLIGQRINFLQEKTLDLTKHHPEILKEISSYNELHEKLGRKLDRVVFSS
jgi:DNA primase